MRRIIEDKNGEYWVQEEETELVLDLNTGVSTIHPVGWRNKKGPFGDVQSARYAMQTGEVKRVVEGGKPE